MRLFPKTLFVLGSDSDIDNVFALETIEGLRYNRGDFIQALGQTKEAMAKTDFL
jgi:hypothetical protein